MAKPVLSTAEWLALKPDSVVAVTEISLCGCKLVLVADSRIPSDEVHLVSPHGETQAKIINIGAGA